MSAQLDSPDVTDMLERLRDFLGAELNRPGDSEERAKVKDLCADIHRIGSRSWLAVAPGFGCVFSGFERLASLLAKSGSRPRKLPKLDDAAKKRARPHDFAEDYAAFDRLSIIYGGLFRGSVIVNYLLGIVAVALTVASILPQPAFVASGVPVFPEFAHYALRIELFCILLIAAIFYYGQTPHNEAARRPRLRRRSLARRIGHRWHERWLEYRVLAERFRYVELMLSLSPEAALRPPFMPEHGEPVRWYDLYFARQTSSAKPSDIRAREYRKQALALMIDQIGHHDANSLRRGAIATRLHRFAVILFFLSLAFCLADLIAESSNLSCVTGARAPILPCDWIASFDENVRSLLLFGAVMAPVLAAAIHGVLATAEYTKVAESSRQIADRIALLVKAVRRFRPMRQSSGPKSLEPIRVAVTAFADAAINEASGWRAMLRDKNIPLT